MISAVFDFDATCNAWPLRAAAVYMSLVGQTDPRLTAQARSAFDLIADAWVISSLGLLPVTGTDELQCSAEQFHARSAQQRQKIIRNKVALVGKESVSGSPAATGCGISQENPPMRIYVIGHVTELRCAASHWPQ